ncbi:MAG: hypothetical protein KDD55_11745, partial [Bdellovibrionales bacterium]|nr:hypothetical protein [Bdellovibrionales bacterium]
KKRSIRASFPYVALIAVVLSPQTLFYDFGIPLFFLPLLGNNDSKRVLLQALMVSWICESLRFVETVPAYAPLVLWYGYLLRDFASCKRS